MITCTWLRSWKRSLERRWTLHQALQRKTMARRFTTRPRLEVLEDRLLLTTYVVTSTADDGSIGTLRDGIKQVNAGTYTEIDFHIAGTGVQTINLTSQLPALTASGVFINGLSQGSSGNTKQLIELNGSGAGSSSDGLLLRGSNCTVSGLIIEKFKLHSIDVAAGSNDSIGGTATGAGNVLTRNSNDGILIRQGVSGITVQGNYIGTDATGADGLSNNIGIEVLGSKNTIGGTASGAGNVISGNKLHGVVINMGTGNQVLGNYIGTNKDGTAALGNKGNGILLGSNNNTVGGTASDAGNVISGNVTDGVFISAGVTGTLVLGNYIGTNKDGTAALRNFGNGVSVAGNNNTVGGTVSAAGNVISGDSNAAGVSILGTGNQVFGNYIGTNKDGTAALGNFGNGVSVAGNNNTVGGTVSAAGNVISGDSNAAGVSILGTDNQVLGNYIGTNFDGTAALGRHSLIGIVVDGNNNTVGGAASAAGNVISGNSDGVWIRGTGVQVLGNTIGANFDGTTALGNSIGIDVRGSNIKIGLSYVSGANIISGNKTGVLIASGVTGVQVLGAVIGTNPTQTAALANGIGIDVAGSKNTIGGFASGAGGVISGNTTDGVKIESSGSGNLVLGNHIGTNASGTAALGNSNGVEVAGNNNTVGGTIALANLISGNRGDGVRINHGGSGNQVLGNYIGTDQTGTKALANSVGIEVNANNNMIGLKDPATSNLISGNTSDGVLIDKGASGNQLTGQAKIGMNASGTAALANSIGVEVNGDNNSIGVIGLGNFIAGNSRDGVLLGKDASGNSVLYNHIGTNPAGTAALGNGVGVEVAGASNSLAGNLISGNSNQGVLILGSGNQESNDSIGTDVTRKAALGNSIGVEVDGNNNTVGGGNNIAGNKTDGVLIVSGASGNVVFANRIGTGDGNTALANNIGIDVAGTGNTIGRAGAGNIISGNSQYGVVLDLSSSGNQLLGNFIGINAAGTGPLANSIGIDVLGINNTIGGAFTGNVLSGNRNDGVLLVGSGNQVLGNYIGTNASATAALGNRIGIHVVNSFNTLGGTASGAGNIISGNSSNGVQIDSGANANQVVNNSIGLNVSGAALGNGGYGVSIASSNNTLGGSVSGAGNSIGNNKSGGVLVSAGSGNSIRLNSIFANGSTNTGPGITLSSGANNNIAAPILTSASLVNGKLTVTGTFMGTAGVIYVLDFYANPTGDAEGKIFLGSRLVKPEISGTQAFLFPFTTTMPVTNPIITATLTDPSGNTSAFSSNLPASNSPTNVAPTSYRPPTALASNSLPATPPLPTALELALDTAALLLQSNALALFELNSLATKFLGHGLPPSSQLLSTVLSALGAPDVAGLIDLQLGLSIADSLEGTMT